MRAKKERTKTSGLAPSRLKRVATFGSTNARTVRREKEGRKDNNKKGWGRGVGKCGGWGGGGVGVLCKVFIAIEM